MNAARTPCIVGVSTSDFGALYRNLDPSRRDYDLAADALYDALEDAGLDKSEIDSVVVGRLGSYLKFCADVGLSKVRYVNFQSAGGNQSGLALFQAALLIQTGQAEVVACVYGNNGRSVRVNYGGVIIPTGRYDDPYGMTSNGAYYAMAWRRHQLEFGTPPETLADIAISIRENAGRNAAAIMRSPMTREDYFASPLIADPLRLLDNCLINDGGVAYIVTTLERARDLKQTPVKVLSSATSGAMSYYYGTEDLWYGALTDVRERLFGRTDITPALLDAAQIYDNFTASVVFGLEGIGVCERGEAGDFIAAGRHRLDGDLPINTAGGHLSEGYVQGWALTVEGVRQLRGQAGERQVKGCGISLDLTCSPICSAHLLGV